MFERDNFKYTKGGPQKQWGASVKSGIPLEKGFSEPGADFEFFNKEMLTRRPQKQEAKKEGRVTKLYY